MTRHVILITYGEPPTAAFGGQLRYSWRILLGLTRTVAQIPAVLLPVIALSRARFRNHLWTSERYGSPLESITREQAASLRDRLVAIAPSTDWRVHVAYEFRDPLLTAVLDRIPASEPADIVPMYVADSAFTHQISRDTVARWQARRDGPSAHVRVLPPLDPEVFGAIAAAHVERECAAREAWGRDWALVLAAHGTLLEPRRPIDTGRVATEGAATAIARRLAPRFGRVQLAWLNHVYGGRWTEPAADVALRSIAEAGFRKVVYFPFGFAADNAESQLEGRIALRGVPGFDAIHLPCVNAAPEYLEALARQAAVTGTGPAAR